VRNFLFPVASLSHKSIFSVSGYFGGKVWNLVMVWLLVGIFGGYDDEFSDYVDNFEFT